MALNIKDSVIGVDIPIQNFQKFLYGQLKTKWGLTDDVFQGYGRCYRNNYDKGYVPELFVNGTPTQYVGIEFDDTTTTALFFLDLYDSERFSKGSTQAKVDLIFIVNVKKIKTDKAPSLTHRGDEEIRNDVERLCQVGRFGFIASEFVTGYNNVLTRFPGITKSDQTTWRDLHPLHVFKITFNFTYNLNDCR